MLAVALKQAKSLFTIILLSVLAGCMGHKPDPVPVSQEGDPLKSCAQLSAELNGIDTNIWRLKKQEDEKSKQNAFFGTTATFLFVPALFMDVNGSQEQEIAAWQQRKTHLLWMAKQKSCGFKDAPPAA